MPDPHAGGYREQSRTYRSTAVIAVAIAAGFLLDLSLGGAGPHLLAWLAALVLIAGFDGVAVHAARTLRTISVTSGELLVGEHAVARSEIVGVDVPAEADVAPIAAAPRGSVLVGVRVAGGGVLGVPSRRPAELAAALGFRAATAPRAEPALLEVRAAEADDLAALPDVERRADAVFTVSGIGPLPPEATPAEFAAAAAVIVAGRPVIGFARLDVADAGAHLESLAVVPGHMRRGVGTVLLEAACSWAVAQGYAHITLCTFADVVWNAPFYARHGFAVLDRGDWTPRLVALREQERAAGLDALGTRVVMRRELGA